MARPCVLVHYSNVQTNLLHKQFLKLRQRGLRLGITPPGRGQWGPKTVHHSNFFISQSPFPMPHFLFLIFHSPFLIRHFPFSISPFPLSPFSLSPLSILPFSFPTSPSHTFFRSAINYQRYRTTHIYSSCN